MRPCRHQVSHGCGVLLLLLEVLGTEDGAVRRRGARSHHHEDLDPHEQGQGMHHQPSREIVWSQFGANVQLKDRRSK